MNKDILTGARDIVTVHHTLQGTEGIEALVGVATTHGVQVFP